MQLLMLSLSTFNLFTITIALWAFPLSRNLLIFYPLPPFPMRMSVKPSRVKPSKSVGLDDIPDFVIKGCSSIFIPILRHTFIAVLGPFEALPYYIHRHIFNLSLTQ
jgi:hypothetical protein